MKLHKILSTTPSSLEEIAEVIANYLRSGIDWCVCVCVCVCVCLALFVSEVQCLQTVRQVCLQNELKPLYVRT
jgi:hypothetical protein